MPLLLAAVLLHEYILKTCLPRYKLKAEALEAANHFVESFFRTRAQEELNRNDMVSLIWDTANDNIKCEISVFGSIKLERKRGGDIFMCIQDGNSRVRIHKDTFTKLYQYKESIQYLISFLEANAFSVQHDGQGLAEQ